RVSFNDGLSYCPFGAICPITIEACPAFGGAVEHVATAQDAVFRMWPNPNRGDQLNLELNAVEDGVSTVYVELYDMFGRRVLERAFPTEGALHTVIDLNDFAS